MFRRASRVAPAGSPLLLSAAPAQHSRRPLSHRDYDSWRSILNPALSRDGKHLAYALLPQEGDGELLVRNLATGQERRESLGTLPPPPDPEPEIEPGPERPPRGVRLAFTAGGRHLVCTTFPSKVGTEEARKQCKKPEEAPRNGLLILDLAGGPAIRIAGVRSMQVPGARPPVSGPRGRKRETQGSRLGILTLPVGAPGARPVTACHSAASRKT